MTYDNFVTKSQQSAFYDLLFLIKISSADKQQKNLDLQSKTKQFPHALTLNYV